MWPIFSGIAAVGKALIGSGGDAGADRVMEVARGVGGWIDEQQYTAEEKAKHLAEMSTRVIDFVGATAGENTQRSITRRSIAIWIMRAEIVTLAATGAVYPFNAEWSGFLLGLADFDSPLGWLACGVAVFFFGSHMLRTVR